MKEEICCEIIEDIVLSFEREEYILGHRYAGLQANKQCFCGLQYGKYGKADDSQCNRICSGDNSQTCGGTWRSQIYQTFTGLQFLHFYQAY